jgi:hypothetical protein
MQRTGANRFFVYIYFFLVPPVLTFGGISAANLPLSVDLEAPFALPSLGVLEFCFVPVFGLDIFAITFLEIKAPIVRVCTGCWRGFAIRAYFKSRFRTTFAQQEYKLKPRTGATALARMFGSIAGARLYRVPFFTVVCNDICEASIYASIYLPALQTHASFC